MFGRRTPDRPNSTPSAPHKAELDLGMLDELPELITAKAPAPQPASQPAPQPPQEEGWASSLLGPSVTQLLREAEVAGQPETTAAVPVAPEVLATPAAAVTQQLPALDLEPAFAAVHEQLWAATDLEAGQPLTPDTSTFAIYHYTEDAEPTQAEPLLPTMPTATEAIAEPWETPQTVVIPEVTAVETTPAPATPAPARTVAESVIGPDDFFDGHYRSERGVRIQGNARGSIESRQYILVEAGAQVEADLAAEEIMVAGTFTGNITCHGQLEITDTGVVQGVITTASLVVHPGGAIDGELRMRRNEG